MENCVFCKIINREFEGSIFYEDDIIIGFMDLNPVNKGHALIIPKKHYKDLSEMDEETGKQLFSITQKTAKAIRKTDIKCEGINLFLADGEAAFQEVFHVHMHVLPRFKGDSFKIDADWKYNEPRIELDNVAQEIKRALDKL